MQNSRSNGFTLIELMIVVAVVAIIAVIAIPAYSDYVNRSRRADAKHALLALQLAQEKLRVDCPFYAQNIGNNNVCGANSAATTVRGDNLSADEFYNLSILTNSATATNFTLNATPTGPQTGDDCGTFSIVVTAASGAIYSATGDGAGIDCWGR